MLQLSENKQQRPVLIENFEPSDCGGKINLPTVTGAKRDSGVTIFGSCACRVTMLARSPRNI